MVIAILLSLQTIINVKVHYPLINAYIIRKLHKLGQNVSLEQSSIKQSKK